MFLVNHSVISDLINIFKSGDFKVRNKECGKPLKKFEDNELQKLLDEDDVQT